MDDFSNALAPQAPAMPAPPQPPQPQGMNLKTAGPLLALIPMALAKGGQGAVAALLHGFQQAQALKAQQAQQGYQNQRQAYGDQRMVAQDQAEQAYREQQLAAQEAQRQQQLRQQFMQAVNGVESPEAANALLEFFGPQADALKIPRADLSTYVSQTVTPTKLQTKAAEKSLAAIEKTYKPEQLAQLEQAGTKFKVGAEMLTLAELRARTGVGAYDDQGNAVGVPAVAKPNAANAGSFEDYVLRFAKEQGKTPEQLTTADITSLRKTYQQADDRPININTGSGLAPRVQQQVAAQARTFESLPAVKNTQIMSEAVSFASALDPNTKNPADDQALIYAFAKAMDPNSVVREGEYATVQKYAQSWADSFGFNAQRVFSNTAFLTPQARQNMKRTIQARFRAAKSQYDAVRQSYIAKINKITGMGDGADWLTDYGAAFPDQPTPTNTPGAAPAAAPAEAAAKPRVYYDANGKPVQR